MLWVKLLGRNGLGSSSLPYRAPGRTGKAGGFTAEMGSYSYAWCLGALWCRSLSMCHLILRGFSTCPGHIKTWYHLFFHWAGSQEVGPGQIKAMLRSGTVWLLLDFICKSRYRVHSYTWDWKNRLCLLMRVVKPHCGRTCWKGNTIVSNFRNILCHKPCKNSYMFEESNSSFIYSIKVLHTPTVMHALLKWPRRTSCFQGANILAWEARKVVYQSVYTV